jgi:hypothetical protein
VYWAVVLVMLGLMPACSIVPTPTGKHAWIVGGKGALKYDAAVATADGGPAAMGGMTYVFNQEKSFRDGMLAAAALSASYYGAVTAKAVEATKQAGAASAAKTQQAAIAGETTIRQAELAAKAEATAAAIGAGAVPVVNPITPP